MTQNELVDIEQIRQLKATYTRNTAARREGWRSHRMRTTRLKIAPLARA